MISLTFTPRVSTNLFHSPQLGLQVRRQSLKYRGTLLLNHLLRKKHYETCKSQEPSKSLRTTQFRIQSECLGDVVFV